MKCIVFGNKGCLFVKVSTAVTHTEYESCSLWSVKRQVQSSAVPWCVCVSSVSECDTVVQSWSDVGLCRHGHNDDDDVWWTCWVELVNTSTEDDVPWLHWTLDDDAASRLYQGTTRRPSPRSQSISYHSNTSLYSAKQIRDILWDVWIEIEAIATVDDSIWCEWRWLWYRSCCRWWRSVNVRC